MAMVEPRKDPLPVKIERVLVSQQEAVVILASENGEFQGKVLPVFIDLGQAMNIQVSLEGRVMGRPLTHDLFNNVLNEMGASVHHVIIEEIAQNTFFATLHVEMDRGGKREMVVFDARPSDCLAMAVRSGAEIQVRRKVLDQACVEREKLFGKTGLPSGGPLVLPSEEEDEDDEDEEEEDDEGDVPHEERGSEPAKKRPRIDPSDLDKP